MRPRPPQTPRVAHLRVAVRRADPHLQNLRLIAAAALLLLVVLAAAATARAAGPAYDAQFNAQWNDGQAELASYDLTYPRYTQTHTGTAVTVIVTEPHNDTKRLKSDRGGPGSFTALKMNLVEDFPTGVYDYNLMTSVFVATEPTPSPGGLAAGDVAKISFSSQEWCGQVWQQAAFRPRDQADSVHQLSHSYFESEGDAEQSLPHPDGGFAEDALILWARGLAGPQPAIGHSVTTPLFRSAALQRLRHAPAAWDTATLTRDSATQATAQVRSNAGDRTYHFTLDPQGMLTQLERSDGYRLTLRKVDRMPYWGQHRTTDQRRLKAIGLEPRGPGKM